MARPAAIGARVVVVDDGRIVFFTTGGINYVFQPEDLIIGVFNDRIEVLVFPEPRDVVIVDGFETKRITLTEDGELLRALIVGFAVKSRRFMFAAETIETAFDKVVDAIGSEGPSALLGPLSKTATEDTLVAAAVALCLAGLGRPESMIPGLRWSTYWPLVTRWCS